MNISKFTKVLLIVVTLFSLLNCEKDEDDRTTWINPEKYTAGPDADTFKFALFSIYDWEIATSGDWVSVNKTSGFPVNVDSISVFVKSNPSRDKRTTKIEIKFPGSGSSSRFLTLTQEGIEDVLKVVGGDIRVDKNAIVKSIEIHSNINWEVEFNPSWMTLSPPEELEFIDTLGVYKYKLDISISENNYPYYHQDSISLIGIDFPKSRFRLDVYQDGNSSLKSDSLSLLSLHNSTGGNNWTNKWDLSQPLSKWHGITLDSVDISEGKALRVVSVNLHDNNLKGDIPELVFDLAFIKRLWLNDNDLTGLVSSNMPYLVSIETLKLGNNINLEGQIPTNIDNLKNLINLSIFNTKFDGTLPASIGNIKMLLFLDLSNNNMTGELPALLGENSELSTLILKNNYFEGALPSTYKNNLNWLNWNVTDMICPQKGTGFTNCSEF